MAGLFEKGFNVFADVENTLIKGINNVAGKEVVKEVKKFEAPKEFPPYDSFCKKQVLFDIFRQFISGTFRQSKTSTFIIAYISRGLLPGFSCSIFFRFIEMVILHQDLIAEKLFPQVNPSE